jgi:predicted acylesterase/phospholipase RssA
MSEEHPGGKGPGWTWWRSIHPVFAILLASVTFCVATQYPFYGEWLLRYPLLALIMLFLILVTYHRFGQDFGLSHLFWHENRWLQFRMGLYVSLLLALQWGIAYEILRDFDGNMRFKDMARFRDRALAVIPLSDYMLGDNSLFRHVAGESKSESETLKLSGLEKVENWHGPFRWYPIDENEFRVARHEQLEEQGQDNADNKAKDKGKGNSKDKADSGDKAHSEEGVAVEDNAMEDTIPESVPRQGDGGLATSKATDARGQIGSQPEAATYVTASQMIRNRFLIYLAFTYLPSIALFWMAIYPPIVPRAHRDDSECGPSTGVCIRGAKRGRPFVRGMFSGLLVVVLLCWIVPPLYASLFQPLRLRGTAETLRLLVWEVPTPMLISWEIPPLSLPYFPGLFVGALLLLWGHRWLTARSQSFRFIHRLLGMEYIIVALAGVLLLLSILQFRVLIHQDSSQSPRLVDWRAVEMILNLVLLTSFIGLIFYLMRLSHNRRHPSVNPSRRTLISSQGAICIMLAFVMMLYGTCVQIAWLADVEGMPVLQALLAIPLLGFLISRNRDRFKLQFPGMEHYYRSENLAKAPVRLQEYFDRRMNGDSCLGQTCAPLLENQEVLNRWHQQVATPDGPGDPTSTKPKMAIVAVSGGSIRSGVWTAKVLTEIEKAIPGFPHHLRLITGASGGMIGASLYAAELPRPEPENHGRTRSGDQLESLVRKLNHDCLHPVACQLALGDLPAVFSSRPLEKDRGKALERAWEELSDRVLAQPIHKLAQGEAEGWRPSLVFSPMLAEDGRRLLISNLDLDFLTQSEGPFLLDEDSRYLKQRGPASEDLYSLSAYQFFRLFPLAQPTFKLSTAIRMSASFPYISPAVSLPTDPPRRVVDAGYYDNFGVNIAMSWLLRHWHWLEENTSGVVLIQVRAFDSPRDIESAERSAALAEKSSLATAQSWRNSLHWLTTPLEAALKARSAGMSFRNDEQIAMFADWLRETRDDRRGSEFFQTVSFDCNATASLNWYITQAEFDEILGCLDADTHNGRRLQKLKTWWGDPSSRPASSRDTGPHATEAETPVSETPVSETKVTQTTTASD